VRLVKLGDFDQPVYAAGPPGEPNTLLVVEKAGRIAVIRDGRRLASPFLDISGKVGSSGSEQGLLSVAFASDYARSGALFVDYTDSRGDIHVDRLTRSAANADRANPSSARTVVVIDHHRYPNHNGGQLQVGPEGDLYVGVGDGGSEGDPQGNGQNRDTLLGKVLRLAPRAGGGYSVPSGNPFAHQANVRPEIWAYGLRNPWRFSFDRLTGALVIGDVGQDQQEEVDFAPRGTGAGANYGWSVFEGTRRNGAGTAPHAVAPVLVASHSAGYCAIIGGYVVRDRTLPSLYGRYLFGDLCHAEIEMATLRHGRSSAAHGVGLSVKDMGSFGEDAAGRVYAVSVDGPVYRLSAG
jgi:glucose/arabinose dehydrogenase